jgi:glycosyltransferase involved in cell wall biosynthesis
VVIPALDEEDNIALVLEALPSGVRAIVVDNGSTDRTAQRAREAGAEVVAEPRRGYGNAILAGKRHLLADPPEFFVILDADLADDPALLPVLLAPLQADEADLVVSKRTDQAEPGSLTWPQRFGNRLALFLIARITGAEFEDLGPFRAMRWSTFLDLELADPTWGWNVEMQIKAVRRGLRVREISLPYRRRHAGDSKISGNIVGTVRAGYRILATIYQHRDAR